MKTKVWRWSNVPIPAQHLIAIALGIVLQIIFKTEIFRSAIPGLSIGIPLIVFGTFVSVWAVIQARNHKMEAHTRLLTNGPYRLSRNPMYVAWSTIHLGIGFSSNSVWIIVLLPLVALYTHFVDVIKEERILVDKFGDEYAMYLKRVRRYF